MDQETRDYAVEKECRAVYQNALYAILHNAPPTLPTEGTARAAVRQATDIALASIMAFKAIRMAVQQASKGDQ